MRGDIITLLQHEGKRYPVEDIDSYMQALDNFDKDDRVAVHIIRNGSRIISSIVIN